MWGRRPEHYLGHLWGLGCMRWGTNLHKDHGLHGCCWLLSVPTLKENDLPQMKCRFRSTSSTRKDPISSSLTIAAHTRNSILEVVPCVHWWSGKRPRPSGLWTAALVSSGLCKSETYVFRFVLAHEWSSTYESYDLWHEGRAVDSGCLSVC